MYLLFYSDHCVRIDWIFRVQHETRLIRSNSLHYLRHMAFDSCQSIRLLTLGVEHNNTSEALPVMLWQSGNHKSLVIWGRVWHWIADGDGIITETTLRWQLPARLM